ncbi:MAG: PEGA domain-containing protein, partial [Alphaproteobacteria bacterium]|nr:PEGA domain-containing protein [Alphaproteobacteria bacterium]
MKKLFLCGALCLLSACSSIVNGTSQEISFKGNVKGIKIKQNGIVLCSVPCTVLIDRAKNGTVLTAEKEGYETEQFSLRTKLSSFFWGNIITGGFFGSTTDATVGGM